MFGYSQYGIMFSYGHKTFHHICNINLPNCQWFSWKHIGQDFLFIGGIFDPVTFPTLHTSLWYDPWFSWTSLYIDIAQTRQKFLSCSYEPFLKYFTGMTRSWRKKEDGILFPSEENHSYFTVRAQYRTYSLLSSLQSW